MVHLKDVARIELGGENYNMVTKINGRGQQRGWGSSWRLAQTRWIPLPPSRVNWRSCSPSSLRV